ncbi:type II CAAX prenyl endopeptidase Rce1 family protein [uncultured Sphaerochaeta sp.]|uniref:CPBP family glutamic-type intramembrane protease n=1 Tax=uncultured Sphaerochaeta sp. TaxID=886478 RepID=UPI002A0A372E|nr:CPBP family glutamic-type intramembrane protease [uncultured Sphaerochaeta sp.]
MLGNNQEKNNTFLQGSSGFSMIAAMLSFVLTVLFWLDLGPILVQGIAHYSFWEPAKQYLLANSPFFAMALGLLVSSRLLLKTTLKKLATDKDTFDFPLFLKISILYGSICLVFLCIGLVTRPKDYQYLFQDMGQKFLLLPLVLLVTPLQTSSEEFLLRCLPVRIFSRGRLPQKQKQILLISGVSALFFCLPHLSNQELAFGSSKIAVLAYYLLFGFAGTYLSLLSGGFEVSLGIHVANNLFIALICNYEHSSLPSLPLIQSSGPIGTWYEVIQLGIAMSCIYLFLSRIKKSRTTASCNKQSF